MDAPLYLSKSDLEDCKCDDHSFELRKKIRYKQLADKERSCKVSHEKISPTLLDRIPDANKMLESVYKADYGKIEYGPLMSVMDSPQTGRPIIIPATANWKDVYRDPNRFRYSSMETPTIQPAKTITALKVPEAETASFWYKPSTNSSSEYTDKISKLGLSNMRNQQRYLAPLLPIKRKLGDCNQ